MSEKLTVEARLHREHRRAYNCWRSMLHRCDNPRSAVFHHYGDRGIKVCPQWYSFSAFLADMGDPPIGKSIDRYPDMDGDYSPNNCRWATQAEQIVNQHRTHFVEINGEKMPIRYAAALHGIDERTVHGRIRRGWSEADALTIPVMSKFRNKDNHGQA